jgi:hypothetical protein
LNIEAMLAAEAQRWRDAAHAMFCNAEPFAIFAEAKAKNVIGAGSGAGLESEFRHPVSRWVSG